MVSGPSKPCRLMQCSYKSRPSAALNAVCGVGGNVPLLRRSSISGSSLGERVGSARGEPLSLFALDALEQRAKIAGAEALIALALDQLVKERSGLAVSIEACGVFQKDLQHVRGLAVSVDQDFELSQLA